MQENYDLLGLAPGATPDAIKAAYHAKLREFPARTHPQEFKAIRAAYEALNSKNQISEEDFFKVKHDIPLEIDATLVDRLHQRAIANAQISLEDLIKLTF